MFRSPSDIVIKPVQPTEDGVQDMYICDLCDDGWLSETEVEIHRSSVHKKQLIAMLREETDNVCRVCVMRFKNSKDTIRHIKSEHLLSSERATRVEREIYICHWCSEIYFNKRMLIFHIYSYHVGDRSQMQGECPKCDRTMRVSTMWYHFRTHKIQSVSCCRICCQKFKDRIRLAAHMKTHMRVYRCEMCGYDTKKEELFQYHIVSRHKNAPSDVGETKICFQRYFMPRNCEWSWRAHPLMAWKGLRLSNSMRICILCREICIGSQEMKNHIILEHMVSSPTKLYKCSCGLTYTNKVLVKHHIFKSREGHHLVLT